MKPPPAPPVYRPETNRQTRVVVQASPKPVSNPAPAQVQLAPPVYRPVPGTGPAQPKVSGPPVYRPISNHVPAQMKTTPPVYKPGPGNASPRVRVGAPPVYRPAANQLPAQLKTAPPVYRHVPATTQFQAKAAAPPVYRPSSNVVPAQMKPGPPVYRPAAGNSGPPPMHRPTYNHLSTPLGPWRATVAQLKGKDTNAQHFDPARTFMDDTTHAEATVDGASMLITTNEGSIHAEIKIANQFEHLYAASPKRPKVLSLRLDRAPCEPCADRLIELKKKYGLIMRIKASTIKHGKGNEEALQKLKDAGIYFQLWTQGAIETKFAKTFAPSWAAKARKHLADKHIGGGLIDEFLRDVYDEDVIKRIEQASMEYVITHNDLPPSYRGLTLAAFSKKIKDEHSEPAESKAATSPKRSRGKASTSSKGISKKPVLNSKGKLILKQLISPRTLKSYQNTVYYAYYPDEHSQEAIEIFGEDVTKSWKQRGLSRSEETLFKAEDMEEEILS